MLGNRKFAFRMKPRFPKSLTKEFPLVDLVNNVDQLAEAKDEVLKRVAQQAASSDPRRLRHAVREYGNERTKKIFRSRVKTERSSCRAIFFTIIRNFADLTAWSHIPAQARHIPFQGHQIISRFSEDYRYPD